jgi:hypothetical protein
VLARGENAAHPAAVAGPVFSTQHTSRSGGQRAYWRWVWGICFSTPVCRRGGWLLAAGVISAAAGIGSLALAVALDQFLVGAFFASLHGGARATPTTAGWRAPSCGWPRVALLSLRQLRADVPGLA